MKFERTGSVWRKSNLALVTPEDTFEGYLRIPKGRAARARYPPAIHVYVFQPAINLRSIASIPIARASFARIELMITVVVAVRLL